MSLIDHTLDPLPRRTTRTDHDVRGGRVWFSTDTIDRARSYNDISWLRTARTAIFGAGLITLGLLLGSGGGTSLLILAGIGAVAFNLPALILKASYTAKAG
ncbi:hypothetical protein AWH62_05985 [Maricaulis sp. W15]|uniref:Uncharacterized protein n=1 Tax=Maricaulis maris TaxID=74318 RepID=A0A495D683_9PROT|nr:MULTISPECIES: hypothetical protein [Maricaulis]OLF75370.1 hypothetical protein AWH62_05985 [Maricaulis sp. W15]RKQ96658.1 hypothetical protein C7435_1991 [Maricaulis maris]